MKFFRDGNDLYTGYAPEGAVEITAEEYAEVMATRTLTHIPPQEAPVLYSEDTLSAMTKAELEAILAEMGISANMTKDNMVRLILAAQGVIK